MWKRVTSATSALVIAAAGLVAPAVASAQDEPDGFEVTFPSESRRVEPGPLTVRGNVPGSLGADELSVVYVIDVSGSTDSGRQDCNGNGSVNENDDLNQDGRPGTILDCEIAGVLALNASIIAQAGTRSAKAGLVVFGSSAVTANFGTTSEPQHFVSLTEPVSDDDPTPKIIKAASSARPSQLIEYNPSGASAGGGTDFNRALTAANQILSGEQGGRAVFFMSDGEGTYSSSLPDPDIAHRTYAVGAGSDRCTANRPLARIAEKTGQTCTYAEEPADLTAIVNSGSGTSAKSVEVSLNGGPFVAASINLLGEWSADVGEVAEGDHSMVARLTRYNGTTEEVTTAFRAAHGPYKILGIGDSYISGEGAGDYDDDGPDKLETCHRSEHSWARNVYGPNKEMTQHELAACSGAVARNVTSNHQIVDLALDCAPVAVRSEEEYERLVGNDPAALPWAFAAGPGNTRPVFVTRCIVDKNVGANAPQITAIDGDESAILVSIGGNDMAFGPLLSGCVVRKTAHEGAGVVIMATGAAANSPAGLMTGAVVRDSYPGCPSMNFTKTASGKNVTRGDFVNARMATVGSQLTGAYQAIGNRAPGAAKLIAATYPRLFSEGSACALGFGFTREDVQWIRKSVDRLDEAISRRARNEGFTVVDTRGEFEENLLCNNSSTAWITGVRLLDLQESFHPNKAGNAAYARLVQGALDGDSQARSRMMNLAAAIDGADEAAKELAAAGFTEAEIEEIADIAVEYVDMSQLGEFTQTDQCSIPVPGETLVYNGSGFGPNTLVQISISGVPDPVEVTADEHGDITGTVMISHEIPNGVVGVDLTGVDPNGKIRILSAMTPFEASAPCEEKALNALVEFEGGDEGTGSLSLGSLGSAASTGPGSGSVQSSGSVGSHDQSAGN